MEEQRLAVFGSQVKYLDFKTEEVSGKLRKLQNDELDNLYSSPDINKVMGDTCIKHERYKKGTHFRQQNLKGRSHLDDPGVDGNKILKFILKEIKREGVKWTHRAQNSDQ
jgi:hypothetical protein